jgi:predicted glycosyltransferase
MISKGHSVLFSVREKENEINLLEAFGFRYVIIGHHHTSSFGKGAGLVGSVLKMLREARRFRPDIYLSHGSIIAAWASCLSFRPHVSMEDTGNREQVRLYLPCTNAVLTSYSFHRNYGKKQIRYNSFHELAYLHPKYFKAEGNFRKRLETDENAKLIIFRFVSWHATHDKGFSGLSDYDKKSLVEEMLKLGRVYISSEYELPEHLKKLRYPLPPETMHQALASADLLIGEGATMTSESCMLGTPAIYINPQKAGTISEQVRLELVYQFFTCQGVAEKAREILSDLDSNAKHHLKRDKFISETIDLTGFLVWFIEHWPASFAEMKKDPGYQNNFT